MRSSIWTRNIGRVHERFLRDIVHRLILSGEITVEEVKRAAGEEGIRKGRDGDPVELFVRVLTIASAKRFGRGGLTIHRLMDAVTRAVKFPSRARPTVVGGRDSAAKRTARASADAGPRRKMSSAEVRARHQAIAAEDRDVRARLGVAVVHLAALKRFLQGWLDEHATKLLTDQQLARSMMRIRRHLLQTNDVASSAS